MPARVAAIVLAAGRGTRFGDTKLLAPYGGVPLLRVTIARMIGLFDEVVVVLGHESTRVAGALDGLPVRTVLNADYVDGMSTSIAAGISALGPDTDAALIALGDQPVPRAVLERLVAEGGTGTARIVAPVYDGKRGNPVLFAREFFPALATLTGDIGAREVIARNSDTLATVAFPFPPPIDVDTPDDLDTPASRRP